MRRFGIKMDVSQKIGLTALSLFAFSYFLPAYDTLRGYSCFGECWDTMWKPDPTDLGNWIYYSGFALANLTFFVLAVALFVSEKSWRFRSIASLIMLLHIASWAVLDLWSKGSTIKIGYYVWLEAYVLLYFAHRAKEPNGSLQSSAGALAQL